MDDVQPTVLEGDDRERMERLSEEVRGRLEEMALVMERATGFRREEEAIVRFLPVQLDRENGTSRFALQIAQRASADAGCLTYCDPPGECKICHATVMPFEASEGLD